LLSPAISKVYSIYLSYIEPLHYVILFLRGEDGWHPTIPIQDEAQPYFLDVEEQHEIDEDSIQPQKHVTIMLDTILSL